MFKIKSERPVQKLTVFPVLHWTLHYQDFFQSLNSWIPHLWYTHLSLYYFHSIPTGTATLISTPNPSPRAGKGNSAYVYSPPVLLTQLLAASYQNSLLALNHPLTNVSNLPPDGSQFQGGIKNLQLGEVSTLRTQDGNQENFQQGAVILVRNGSSKESQHQE